MLTRLNSWPGDIPPLRAEGRTIELVNYIHWRIYRVETRPGLCPGPAGASGPRPASWKGSKGSALGGVQGRSPWSENYHAAFIYQHILRRIKRAMPGAMKFRKRRFPRMQQAQRARIVMNTSASAWLARTRAASPGREPDGETCGEALNAEGRGVAKSLRTHSSSPN